MKVKRIIEIEEKDFEQICEVVNETESSLGITPFAGSIIAQSKPYEERPQGEWKLLYKGDESHSANYECSICQREIYIDAKTESLTDYPFCHCGADMRPKGGAE